MEEPLKDDTLALEPTMEIIRKFKPELEYRLKSPMEGFAAFFSNQKLKNAVGFNPKKSWREYL